NAPKYAVYCESGVWVPELAYRTYREGLSGIEHICGIPGRLGGLVYMNGGSNRRAISENLESILVINSDGEVINIDSKTLSFAYRTSPFQDMNVIIAAATLTLEKSERNDIRHTMRKTLASRRRKFPRKQPNCGSVFASNPAMYETVGPPGYAIEKVGLKGHKIGEAQISPMHANFIVNLGKAKAKDVLSLIKLAREKVYQDTNFYMDCEVRYVFPDGVNCKAHEV
ncbi:UDP-N-acetylmuramate dehydrogenase, partial [Vibrio lentus]|uniref:UDP-N-acetylmuramate dehydrogenase n=1 Tax=Vibrio lentus TaxID=136468 RepID=UPI001055D365